MDMRTQVAVPSSLPRKISRGDHTYLLTSPSAPKQQEGAVAGGALFCPKALEIDAELGGNETRFLNDYRQVATEPNVRFEVVYDTRRPYVIAVTTCAVAPDEELLADYGTAYWEQLGKRRKIAEGKHQDGEGETANTALTALH